METAPDLAPCCEQPYPDDALSDCTSAPVARYTLSTRSMLDLCEAHARANGFVVE